MELKIKRVYEKPELDLWEKSIAPSSELWKGFDHEPEKLEEFRKKYREELEENPETERVISLMKEALVREPVILLFGAKDREHNQAVVLLEFLQEKGSAS